MNVTEKTAAEELWESYPNFKRPVVPSEFIDAFEPRIKEMGFTNLRITGDLEPFYADFNATVTIIKKTAWTSEPSKFYDAHVGTFRLQHMAGCGGILLSHGAYVARTARGKGIGTLMQEMKVWLASKMEAGMLLATVIVGNEAEEGLLGKHGWKQVGPPFRNVHTENNVQMWQKILT